MPIWQRPRGFDTLKDITLDEAKKHLAAAARV